MIGNHTKACARASSKEDVIRPRHRFYTTRPTGLHTLMSKLMPVTFAFIRFCEAAFLLFIFVLLFIYVFWYKQTDNVPLFVKNYALFYCVVDVTKVTEKFSAIIVTHIIIVKIPLTCKVWNNNPQIMYKINPPIFFIFFFERPRWATPKTSPVLEK